VTDELQLINAAKAGSAKAFADLVVSYRVRRLRVLLSRGSSHADAEDALQDTFIAAYRYLYSYDPRWRFSTWLYRIAIRKVRTIRHDNTVDIDDLSDDEGDPLLHCIAASDTENLWISARRVLNDDVFTATWLRYAEDMSISDISTALDRSDSWTKVNLLRARKALGAEMNRENNGNEAYG
jgi:RNA polymerase sigma-70 factor (ECF subfamily)